MNYKRRQFRKEEYPIWKPPSYMINTPTTTPTTKPIEKCNDIEELNKEINNLKVLLFTSNIGIILLAISYNYYY